MPSPRMPTIRLVLQLRKTAPNPRVCYQTYHKTSLMRLDTYMSHHVSAFCTSAELEEPKLSSYLCVPPSMSQRHVGILTPYFGHIDFSPRGIERSRANLARRGMPAMDLEGLARDWARFKDLRAEVSTLEREQDEIRQEIRRMLERGMTEDQTRELTDSVRRIRDRAKPLLHSAKDLQETLMPRILVLPNDIHPATPLSAVASDLEDDAGTGSGPYYRGLDAFLELAASDYFSDLFAENGFEPFSGPDFCKPIVVEGCGLNFNDPSRSLHLKPEAGSKRTEFHLTGSASLPSFCAYFTKCSVPASLLPTKYFAVGRCYDPPKNDAWPAQSSRLNFFVATGSPAEEETAFSSCVEMLAGAYGQLRLGCRLVEATAAEISPAESRCTRLQLRSRSGLHRTVASVASCGEFISRRLWMCRHQAGDGGSGFLRVVHGTGMSFPALLDCVGHQANGEIQLPAPLRRYVDNYRRSTKLDD